MKLITTLLVLAVTTCAQASQQATTPATYTTQENDCLGVALVAEAAAIYYGQGMAKEDFIKRVSAPERMKREGYRAMYPTVERVADSIYSGKPLESAFETYVNPCLANVGKPPLH